MAIPTGSGTEVLKLTTKDGVAGVAGHVLITGVANHIYTVLSISITEMEGDTGKKFSIRIGDINVVFERAINGRETFVWNDRLVISGATDLSVYLHESSNAFDMTCSYIDQDWT